METKSQLRDSIHNWYAQHSAAMLLFGITLTGDRHRAQDAVHDVFLKLLGSSNLSLVEAPRTYLFSALRNTIISDVRRRGREETWQTGQVPWFENPSRDPAEELHLRRALAALPEDQREVMILHVWGGLTFAEVAEVLGINSNTAAARYRYALAKLRDFLSPPQEAPSDQRSNG